MKTKLPILILLGLFSSCMTTQKATSFLERYGQLAGLCAAHYPVIDSQGSRTVTYNPAPNIDYTGKLDSLKVNFADQLQAFRDAASQQASDTPCVATIQALQAKYEALQASYMRLQRDYKPCNPDTAYITQNIYHDTNPAKTAALSQIITRQRIDSVKADAALQTAQGKASRRGKLMWGTWILIALVGGGYFFLKGRTALIMSVINKAKNIV